VDEKIIAFKEMGHFVGEAQMCLKPTHLSFSTDALLVSPPWMPKQKDDALN
jgi:hypothetical protein